MVSSPSLPSNAARYVDTNLLCRRPMRNIQFAKDEALFAARRLKKVGSLSGRTPDIETEV